MLKQRTLKNVIRATGVGLQEMTTTTYVVTGDGHLRG